jgi:hypothetical protein
VRFDPCYYVGYKCNLRRLEEYQNLSNDLRELYQTPSIAKVCDITVPIGPTVDYARPHDRELRTETPPITGANRADAEAPALKIAIRELAEPNKLKAG